MKYLRVMFCITIMLAAFILQSCGSAKSDTNGSLTVSTPTQVNNNDGTVTVTTSVTYTPPAGKVPNGVVINISESEVIRVGAAFVTIGSSSFDDTLTSSNTRTYSFTVIQNTTSAVTFNLNASIGDMSSSVSSTVPVLASVSAPAIQFLSTDPGGTNKTTTISGGIQPYTLGTITNGAGITVSLSGTTLSVTTLNAPDATSTTALIPIEDSIGNIGVVQVTYF